jgi:hypothetical protein
MQEILIQIGTGTGLGIAYGLVVFCQKALKSTTPAKKDSFEISKIIRTSIIGAILGGLAAFKGVPLGVDNYEVYLAANTGVIAAVEPALIAITRLIKR